MTFKKILDQLNILVQCRKYGLPLWQCPQLLFLIMGLSIAIISILSYLLGTRYIVDPVVVSTTTLLLAAFLLASSFVIVKGLERLAEANRMKSEFVSIVSHQLRSPLSNLKWSLELLMFGKLGEPNMKQAEYFKILAENTARMAELVSDLLIVSRIEQGRMLFQKREFSLSDLVKEIIGKYKPYAAASNISITLDAAATTSTVEADPSQAKSVIENLLDNAIRYSKGGGAVKMKITEKERNLLFEIEDSGVGIPQQDHTHIFQKFFRSANALKHQTEGSGLGLYIAKSIIDKSGGKLGFTSQEGKGSTFWFTLPIK